MKRKKEQKGSQDGIEDGIEVVMTTGHEANNEGMGNEDGDEGDGNAMIVDSANTQVSKQEVAVSAGRDTNTEGAQDKTELKAKSAFLQQHPAAASSSRRSISKSRNRRRECSRRD